ncbi:MAG: lipoyl(octanoyl) transferase LipB [Chloroflexi bacterium]|nr:lipoyl(octanoyl) transferase LipB [Chloroflexota bacterium]
MTVYRPGLVAYGRAYDMQQRLAATVRAGERPSLILLEHPPTYTLGVRGDAAHILAGEARLHALGAEVTRTDRGGDVTFHGPGQIVGYPIVDLRALGIGVADYVRGLEAMLIATLAGFGIAAGRSERNRGVWARDAKIAAIGVRVARGVTTHGFALNVNTDLSWFTHIVPCGLTDATVTSMAQLAGRAFDIQHVEDAIIEAFARQFHLDPDTVGAQPAAPSSEPAEVPA